MNIIFLKGCEIVSGGQRIFRSIFLDWLHSFTAAGFAPQEDRVECRAAAARMGFLETRRLPLSMPAATSSWRLLETQEAKIPLDKDVFLVEGKTTHKNALSVGCWKVVDFLFDSQFLVFSRFAEPLRFAMSMCLNEQLQKRPDQNKTKQLAWKLLVSGAKPFGLQHHLAKTNRCSTFQNVALRSYFAEHRTGCAAQWQGQTFSLWTRSFFLLNESI